MTDQVVSEAARLRALADLLDGVEEAKAAKAAAQVAYADDPDQREAYRAASQALNEARDRYREQRQPAADEVVAVPEATSASGTVRLGKEG